MSTLVYKRTHKGDPDLRGIFGINDCMGIVRDWNYNAVIGVGGVSAKDNIKYKVNWIGIGPRKGLDGRRAHQITFDHFVLFDEKGPDFRDLAPTLAQRIYSTSGRVFMSFHNETEQAEIDLILKMAEDAPPSERNNTNVNGLRFDSRSSVRGESCPEPCNDKKQNDTVSDCVPHKLGKCVKNRKKPSVIITPCAR